MRARGETAARPAVRAIVVVVPARDEEAEIAGALGAVAAAAERAGAPDLPVVVAVVLHRCTDRTEDEVCRVAADHPALRWVVEPSRASTLGEVRAEGVTAGVAALRGRAGTACPEGVADPGIGALGDDEVWVTSTDADSRVPADWLVEQRRLADEGVDLVLGSVEPEDDGSEAARLWLAHHHLVDGHTAIHGANLGVRLAAYLAVGGFAERQEGEDVDLVHRLRDGAAPVPWTSTDRTRVLTSARREGRAERGFARFLRRLDDVVETHGVTAALQERLREQILRLAHERGPEKTLCPSEAAGAVDPDRRQALTHVARAVACGLADEGLVVITQRGVPVDGRTTPGPVRVRLVG